MHIAEASGLYSEWVDTLPDMKDVTEPVAKTIYLKDLMDMYDRAKSLLATDDLNGFSLQEMKTVTNQPLHSHVLMANA